MARIHCISLRLSTAVTSTGYWLLSDIIELIWHLWMTSLGCRNTLSSYCCSWWIWSMTLYMLYFWIYAVTFKLPTVCCLKKTHLKYNLKITQNQLLSILIITWHKVQFSGLRDIRCQASDEAWRGRVWQRGVSAQHITHENTNGKLHDLNYSFVAIWDDVKGISCVSRLWSCGSDAGNVPDEIQKGKQDRV